MNEISKRIANVIAKSGLTYRELEAKTDISRTTLNKYATGKIKKIPYNAIKLIAEATNSSITDIISIDDINLKTDEKEFFDVYGNLAPNLKQYLLETAKDLLETQKKKPND